MVKKILIVLSLITVITGFEVDNSNNLLTSCCRAESHEVNVDRNSAWFNEEKHEFGADVSVNKGDYQAIAYRMVRKQNGESDVYQMKNNNGNWVYIGVKGVDKHSYSFPSKLSITIFVMVANNAAWTKGYDHMF